MQIQFDNSSLLYLATEVALIKSPVAAGSAKDITVDDNSDIAQNDYILAGELAKAKSEVFKVNAAVTAGVVVQADALTFPHSPGTKLYKIPYNQVRFYYAATIAGAKTLKDTIGLDADNEYTTYDDTTNVTGYYFFTLYNSTTTAESGYSAAFNIAESAVGTRIRIRRFVKGFYKKPIDEDLFTDLCDTAEGEIFSMRRWRFREKSVSFSTVANQQDYDLDTILMPDLGQIVYCTYDGDPVIPVDAKTHKMLNWSLLSTGSPRAIWEWNRVLKMTPTPTEVKTVVVDYYKDSSGFTDETSESGVKLPQAIGFRVLQDLWSVDDPKKSQYFERRYLQVIAAMKANDMKQVSKFHALTDSRIDKRSMSDQVENPSITV